MVERGEGHDPTQPLQYEYFERLTQRIRCIKTIQNERIERDRKDAEDDDNKEVGEDKAIAIEDEYDNDWNHMTKSCETSCKPGVWTATRLRGLIPLSLSLHLFCGPSHCVAYTSPLFIIITKEYVEYLPVPTALIS